MCNCASKSGSCSSSKKMCRLPVRFTMLDAKYYFSMLKSLTKVIILSVPNLSYAMN